MRLLALIFGCLSLVVVAAHANDLAAVADRIAAQEAAIAQGTAKLDEVQKALSESANAEARLSAQSQKLQSTIRRNRIEAERIRAERTLTKHQIEDLRKGASQASLPLVAAGEQSWLKILFGRNDIEDIIVADVALRGWTQQAAEDVGRYAGLVANLDQESKRLARLEATMQQDKRSIERSLAESKSLKSKRANLQASLRSDLSLRKTTLAGLQEEAKRLNELMREQQRQAKNRGSSKSKSMGRVVKTPILAGKPRLLRPFGRYKDRTTGLELTSTGVVLFAAPGTVIKAAAAGDVVYADWFRGYGWLVIARHSNGQYTLYGHCSELLVKQGDEIKRGQSIAHSGASGTLDGPSVYFEVRDGTTPQDPLVWLASAK